MTSDRHLSAAHTVTHRPKAGGDKGVILFDFLDTSGTESLNRDVASLPRQVIHENIFSFPVDRCFILGELDLFQNVSKQV